MTRVEASPLATGGLVTALTSAPVDTARGAARGRARPLRGEGAASRGGRRPTSVCGGGPRGWRRLRRPPAHRAGDAQVLARSRRRAAGPRGGPRSAHRGPPQSRIALSGPRGRALPRYLFTGGGNGKRTVARPLRRVQARERRSRGGAPARKHGPTEIPGAPQRRARDARGGHRRGRGGAAPSTPFEARQERVRARALDTMTTRCQRMLRRSGARNFAH